MDKTSGHVCDLLWENGVLAKVQVKEDTIQGNLTAVSDTAIEIEGYGELKRSENLPVYKIYGTIEEKDLSNIVIANMKVEYVVAEDRVEAILLVEPAQISRIRVLLLADDGSAYRNEVFLGADGAFQIITKEGNAALDPAAVVKASELFASSEENSVRIQGFLSCAGIRKALQLSVNCLLNSIYALLCQVKCQLPMNWRH